MRRNATSAESTFGRGRNTSRETGWKPVRSVASCTSTETAPYAFVDGCAKKRSATSRCTITHQSSSCSSARLSATIGVATLYGRFATSLCGGGLERGDVEAQRVAPVDRRALDAGEVLLEPPVDLDRVHVRDALGEEAREHAEPGPDLEHDVVGLRARRAAR